MFAVVLLALTFPSVFAIPLEDFYPFGGSAGDNSFGRTVDGSSDPTFLSAPFLFYQTNYATVYVSLCNYVT